MRLLPIVCLLCLSATPAKATDRDDALLMKRVFAYAAAMDTVRFAQSEIYSYMKFHVATKRRNVTLMAVPSMMAVSHGGKREYAGESYARMMFRSMDDMDVTTLLSRSTIPRSRRIMPTLAKYMIPDIYGELLISNHILSPFYRRNRRYYRYHIEHGDDGTATISFTPKLDNTRLVKGRATVDSATGQIIDMRADGEYDMVNFNMDIEMGERGVRTLIPEKCSMNARFRFLGNDIALSYTSMHGLPRMLTDSVTNRSDTTLLRSIRPIELTAAESRLFAQQDSARAAARADTTRREKKRTLADKLWDSVGEHLFTRTNSRFGNKRQGHVRINPLLNPLYFGYSGRRGFSYKFDLRGRYNFTNNSQLSMRFKAGYSFKQRQFYFDMPINYYFDIERDGYVQLRVANGNRIRNTRVTDALSVVPDSTIASDLSGMNQFNDFNFRLSAHYDLSDRLSVQAGIIGHRRSAVDKKAFDMVGMRSTYTSVAPMCELEYRPLGFGGPVFTLDYERSIKGLLGADLEYERYELDGQYIIDLSAVKSLQLRAGAGFYTHRGKDRFFLDFSNFKENNVPGGWYDEWACDFELLNSNWYNSSRYYVRANLTYESPLLVLAWIPWVGHFMEKERIYVNALTVTGLNPYMEYGYGFKTRLFSAGIFVGQRNGKFNDIGFKVGVELFRHW